MHQPTPSLARSLVAALMVLGLAGCGNISKNIARDGSHAEQLAWPAPDSTTPLHDGGTSPTLESLRRISAGMEKQQIANLIGYPHFSEGAWGVREWDYLFHLPAADGEIRCQYKILFDEDTLARSFYWKPATCADLLKAPAAAAPVSFTLSADALFEFDSDRLGAEGKRALDDLAGKIEAQRERIASIRIIGYTDPLGSKGYNGLLSQQRAHAVMRYLAGKGVPAGLMTATGLGESHPVKTGCDVDATHAERVACLAPNRRVEVQVFGTK